MVKKHILGAGEENQETVMSWLDVDSLAEFELTSEDPEHPIDSAIMDGNKGQGWQAFNPGEQTIRICFHEPQRLRRIRLVFQEEKRQRTQQFALRWLPNDEGFYREIVRQQFNFSPSGSQIETEDYRVNLEKVKALEINIIPDISRSDVVASLKQISLA